MEAFRIRNARPLDLDDILIIEDESFDPAVRESREIFRFEGGDRSDGAVLRRPRVFGFTDAPSTPMMMDKELP